MPSQADFLYMQRLMRDVVPDAFEKFFNESSIKNWSGLVQDDILHSAFALMDLITAQLKVRKHSINGWTSFLIPGQGDCTGVPMHDAVIGFPTWIVGGQEAFSCFLCLLRM